MKATRLLLPLLCIQLCAPSIFVSTQAHAGFCGDLFDELFGDKKNNPELKRALRKISSGSLTMTDGKTYIFFKGENVLIESLLPSSLGKKDIPISQIPFFMSFLPLSKKPWKALGERTFNIQEIYEYEKVLVRLNPDADDLQQIEPGIYLGDAKADRYLVIVKHANEAEKSKFARKIDSTVALIRLEWDEGYQAHYRQNNLETTLILSEYFVNEDNALLIQRLFGEDVIE